MSSLRIVTACFVSGIALAACGDGDKKGGDAANLDVQFPDGTSPDGEVSSSVSYVELCDGYAAAACNLDKCFYPGSTVSQEDCRKATRDICQSTVVGAIGTHIDGDILFNGDAAAECIDHFADAACETIGDVTGDIPAACEEVFDGTLAEGTACAFDALCKPELFCKGTATGDTCSGTCTKRKLLGESCDNADALCARGLLCTGGETGTCISHHAETGGACLYNEHCPATDRCKDHLCVTRTPAGQACDNFGCVSGYTCLDGTCQPLPDSAGDACEFGCANDLLCVTNVCAVQPVEGDDCIGEFHSCGSEFETRLQCDPASNKCIKWYQLGDTCGGVNRAAQCDGGYCDSTLEAAGTCVAFKGPGDACAPFTNECGRLGCTEAGVCGVDRDPCRGLTTIAPL